MKNVVTLLFLLLFAYGLPAQNHRYIDSLKETLNSDVHDLAYQQNFFQVIIFYLSHDLDSSLEYVKQFNQIPFKTKEMETHGMIIMGDIYLRLGNASKSLQTLLKAVKLAEQLNEPFTSAMLYWNMGKVYQNQLEYERAIGYFLKAVKISSSSDANNVKAARSKALADLGLAYLSLNNTDSALYYSQSCYGIVQKMDNKADLAKILAQLGRVYEQRGNTNSSMNFYRMALNEALLQQDLGALSEAYINIAGIHKKFKSDDSSYYYARLGFITAEQLKNASSVVKASNFLKNFFKDKKRPDSAFQYQEIETVAKDSMLSLEAIKKVQIISFEEQQRVQERATQEKEAQTRMKLYALVASLAIFLLIAFFLYRNNRQKQRVNTVLQKQKSKIQNTLAELKATQAQLIQSEKMAALGELTAGIAHEIQNPLNFVNNFSEVNKELANELKGELATGNMESAIELADNIIDNEEKINHHGKRADSIVKGMLQHSRTSSGQKELTDINALTDEYLRLAYHGMRAKNKEFNAEINTAFNNSIGKINVVPQDIGRVLINLFNNAFYAVSEREKLQATGLPAGKAGFKPQVIVSTKRLNDRIEIAIRDNGSGIPQKILDKIFQPFFTTKPTGEGTGLGLSLAYDIVKAHGGEIKMTTSEGGSEFVIQLPTKSDIP